MQQESDPAARQGEVATLPARRKLVLFIHGINGAKATTFEQFPEFLRDDHEIGPAWEVADFDYHTAMLAASCSPHPAHVARMLATEIDHRYGHEHYDEIAILAHSQGGLITRRYIADVLKERPETLRVSRVIYFATPNMGVLGAKLGAVGLAAATKAAGTVFSYLPGGNLIASAATAVLGLGPSEQFEALAYNSPFLLQLMSDEANLRQRADARDKVWARYVLAGNDAYVGISSAWGAAGPGEFEVVPDTTHTSLVKPATPQALSFLIARHTILSVARPPWAADADHTQPNLSLKDLPSTDADRFVYWSRTLPFIGREDDQEALAKCLGDPQKPFRWMLVSGPGGMGKSRLALELVLSQASGGWHAGFLESNPDDHPNWSRWQPRVPTLLIVDYAGREAGAVAAMLKGLAERDRKGPHTLRYPVRVVLIERDAKGPWLDTILNSSPVVRGDHTHGSDWELKPLADVWPIFEHVLTVEGAAKAGRDATLQKLTEIDREQRPLFAYLMADAMKAGHDVRAWDRAALLADVIDRDRWKFWLKEAGAAAKPADILKEECALALATMAATSSAPLTRQELKAAESPLLPAWDIARHPAMFKAMTGHASAGIRPLEPDIVGEFFALETLKRLATHDAADAQSLVELAWQIRPDDMWWFVSRCVNDFPEHAEFKRTYAIKPPDARVALPWSMAAVNLTNHLGPRVAERDVVMALYGEVRALAARGDATAEIRLHQAMAASALITLYLPRTKEGTTVNDLLRDLKALVEEHPGEPELRSYEQSAAKSVELIRGEGETLQGLLQMLEMLSSAVKKPNANPLARSEYAVVLAGALPIKHSRNIYYGKMMPNNH